MSGRVLHQGRPQGGCHVLAIDEKAGRVVSDVETGPDGAWRMDAGEASLIFARCRGEALGVAHAPVAPGPIDLEIGPTHPATVRVTGDLPRSVQPQLSFMALQLDSTRPELLRWVTAPVRDLSSRVLARFEARELRLELQPGTWWLSAGYTETVEPRAIDMPDPAGWRAVCAREASRGDLPELKGGFRIDVTGPVAITVELAPA